MERNKKLPPRPPVEIKVCSTDGPDPNLKSICLVCKKPLEVDSHSGVNGETYPMVYGGVVFRSDGQYGSTVLDCGAGIPAGWENGIQIIVCDKCLVENAGIINAFRNKRTVIER